VNIDEMNVGRSESHASAVMVITTKDRFSEDLAGRLLAQDGIIDVDLISLT
jgi:hypothetical protein